MNIGSNSTQVKRMNPIQYRRYLNSVEKETWANLGKFFANYITDTELERWITYWYSLNKGKSLIESPDSFTQMLTYFLESVFDQAEKYNSIPDELKEFIESSGNALLVLGIYLEKSVKAFENQRLIMSMIEEKNYAEKPSCSNCAYLEALDEIISIMTNDNR